MTREEMEERLGPHMIGTLERYIEHGIPTGGFVEAVLSNDLFDAMARADDINQHLIHEIVSWIYNYAPSSCHGSRERCFQWIKAGGEKGQTL